MRRSVRKKKALIRTFKYILPAGFLVFAVYLGWFGVYSVFNTNAARPNPGSPDDKKGPIVKDDLMDKKAIQALLLDHDLATLENQRFKFVRDGKTFRAQTSLDLRLHNFLSSRLDRKHARWIGIVVMKPSSGRIVTMIGYDKSEPTRNPCTDNRFPAASIFKIITASAAIEKCDYVPETMMMYNGSKYTLYKSQLKKKKNRYTHRVSFKNSFAQSINPVFGKIGVHCLNKSDLENYSAAFGFNQHIPFELPLPPSRISISDDPYNWAEIASGFNRETKLSPVHGALLTAAVVNNGWLVEPTVIDHIMDESGKVVYQSRRISIRQAITPEASEILRDLMTATVKNGTPRKHFRRSRRDKVLSKLTIGGKTGSIYNQSRNAKIDWFVGFAQNNGSSEQIAISVMVAHGKYIGKKATDYARMAIREYFKGVIESNMASRNIEKRL